MQRYNIFNLIHKALRNMMYDTAQCLQQTNFADMAEAATALEKTEQVVFNFERHAHHEDHYVLPAVAAFDSELVASFEAEHETDIIIGNKLKNLLNIYRACNFTEERMACGSAIHKAFIDFMVFNLVHMGKEETLINTVLWQHYTDEQLVSINNTLVASIPPHELMATSQWMIRSISSADAIAWLSAAKMTAPPAAIAHILESGRSYMTTERYSTIAAAIA